LAGKPVDRRADLFAFGCIVYEMLTGKPLFRGRDILAIIMGQMHWSLPPAGEISPRPDADLYAVLQESLAKEPGERVLELGRIAEWSAPVEPSLLE